VLVGAGELLTHHHRLFWREERNQYHPHKRVLGLVRRPRRCDLATFDVRERRAEPYITPQTDLIHAPQHSPPTNEL
jgi:hypothetical protein